MKRTWVILLLLTLTLFSGPGSVILSQSETVPTIFTSPGSITTNQELLGVVVIDNIHQNDYSAGDTTFIEIELENMGYIVEYTSDFDTWTQALSVANYLIISAPFLEINTDEIQDIKTWFTSQPANLLLSSRGDFSEPDFTSMNALFTALETEMRVQDDNVYTTDFNAPQPWYIDTDNFNTAYPSLFQGVDSVSFFSPSSISYGGTSQPLIFAEARAYQSNEAGDPPAVVYDDTDDGIGGDVIPIGVIDEVSLGLLSDRIITLGTTIWSDFDYGDTFADDIILLNNIMTYFHDQTLEVAGEIPINIEDNQAPTITISFPHDNAFLTGQVQIDIEAIDLFDVDSYEVEMAGEVVSTSPNFILDTTVYTDGIYNLKASATDTSGNTASVENTYYLKQGFEPFLDAEPKIMTYNIKESGIFKQWFDVMIEENADIAILIETGDFDNENNRLLNEYTSLLNEMFFDEKPYQSSTLQDIDSSFNGITIFSRYDIISNLKLSFLQDDSGTNVFIPLPFQHSVLNVNEEVINIIGAHLTCCPTESNWNQRLRQQESILNYMDALGDEAIIYLGDMNSASPDDVDPASQDIETDLGTEPIEMVLDSSHPKASEIHTFVDVAQELGTKGSTHIITPISRIDYIFVNQHFENSLLTSTTGDTLSAPYGSDHASVDVELDWSDFISEPVFDLPTFTNTVLTDPTDTTSSESDMTNSTSDVALSLNFLWIISIPTIIVSRKFTK